MHHQRSACAASDAARASASRATAGTAGRRRSTSTTQPTQQAGVQQRPSTGSGRAPVSTPPRANAQRSVAAARPTSSASRSTPTATTRTVYQSRDGSDQPSAAGRAAPRRTPGPIAISTPGARRASAGRVARACRASTCSTDDDDRLPTRASDCQRRRRAPRGRGRARPAIASRTFGPPGCATQVSTSRDLRPCSARKSSTSSPRCARRRRRRSAARTIRKPVPPMSQPMTRSVSG